MADDGLDMRLLEGRRAVALFALTDANRAYPRAIDAQQNDSQNRSLPPLESAKGM